MSEPGKPEPGKPEPGKPEPENRGPERPLHDVYLRPGEMFLAREPTIIRTILGSCVGVTFWCARLGAGALCHALLPRCPVKFLASPVDARKYVDFCVRDLARQFAELGAARGEIQVKLFGGADILFTSDAVLRPTVGYLNCQTALEVLGEQGFEAAASNLGDTCGRKIRFNTQNGDVLLRRLV